MTRLSVSWDAEKAPDGARQPTCLLRKLERKGRDEQVMVFER